MRLPDDPNKYTSRFKYIEVGRIIENFKDQGPKFVREQIWNNKIGTPKLIDVAELSDYAAQYDDTNIYRSVYQYDIKDVHKGVPLGPLYFDLDHKTDLFLAFEDAQKILDELLKYIPIDAIDIYFSGMKGCHIEVEPLVLGISASDDLPKISSFIAHDLEQKLGLKCVDYQVYDIRRMWRVPNTKHGTTGNYKVECKDLLLEDKLDAIFIRSRKKQEDLHKPEQHFDYHANRWYREYSYQYEQSLLPKYNSGDLFSRFLEQGSGYVRNFDDTIKKFDKFKLVKGCPTIQELEIKAKKNHHLDHYERLFLCSLLTYTEESIRYLHEILENCSDYHFEISNAHIEDWVKRREYGIGGRPFTCQKAKEVGIICSGCSKMEPRPKLINTGDGKYIESEEKAQPSPIRYAYTMLKSGEL
jgi:hypothetical protein